MAIMTRNQGDMWLESPAFRRYERNRPPSRVLSALAAAPRAAVVQQVSLVVFAYFAYFLVRGFTEGDHARAVSNAVYIVGLEKHLGFFWEPAIQRHVVTHHWIVTLANWMYIWGHWPLIATVAM